MSSAAYTVATASTALTETPASLKVLPHHQYVTPDDISPATVRPNPLDEFHVWFRAVAASTDPVVPEPEAMTLATATPDGIPSARVVLFKELDRAASSSTPTIPVASRKNYRQPPRLPRLLWKEIHKSVRILGNVEKVDRAESEAYFRSRPAGSRVGAWASRQSTVVQEGEVQARLEKLRTRFGGDAQTDPEDVPLPDFWGGWRVVPFEMEFWCGKPSRLHDRVQYTKKGEDWVVDRLSP
ncbi:hypothetical protein BD626DRAFT_547787 [Schizophyllum amplum]|uniref:pyridoxal 5'-phosphate synthase n=1 Tax=Schizophyllum amplum TaxID=97359 RepID=A0A550CH65_9AGAR|nr:hypothetical protein BD626DRAFT_547787 [Auriculariopsis ampla]